MIVGGSGSGKSAYAEAYVMRHSEENARYYLATMQVYGEEGRKKVERHRKMRAGKGFQTIEQPRNLSDAVGKIPSDGGVLLECLSNLVANEMFLETGIRNMKEVTETVLQGMEILEKETAHLIVVTNDVFEDGIFYERGTMEYLQCMGEIHIELAEKADTVVEVVAGIPFFWKGSD